MRRLSATSKVKNILNDNFNERINSMNLGTPIKIIELFDYLDYLLRLVESHGKPLYCSLSTPLYILSIWTATML